jgi:hypothetical protein
MNEMVERIARALCRDRVVRIFAEAESRTDNIKIGQYPLLTEFIEDYWKDYIFSAKAALAAIREPTEAMKRAGSQELDAYDDQTKPDNPEIAAAIYRGMIDEALR